MMKRKVFLVVVILLAGGACTSPSPTASSQTSEQGAEPSEPPASPASVNTLPPAWTPTFTQPPTITPTITLTPTQSPTRTPRPTRPPADEIVREDGARVSLASATIHLSDLPAGYNQLPLEDYIENAFMFQDEDLQIATFAVFADEAEENIAMSMTFVFPNEEDLREFDDSLSDIPEEMATNEEFNDLPEEMGIDMSFEIMEDFQKIGNNSIAFRMSLTMDTESILYEIVMFRRGPVGASVFVIGVGDFPAQPRLADLATLLDQRILAVFQD